MRVITEGSLAKLRDNVRALQRRWPAVVLMSPRRLISCSSGTISERQISKNTFRRRAPDGE